MSMRCGLFLLLLIAINAANGLQCHYCNNDACTQTSKFICDKNAVIQTYTVFDAAFMLDYQEPQITKKYECLTINTTFVDGDNKNFDFVFKGCIVNGFDACGIRSNRMYHRSESRKHCKVCAKDFCNKNSSRVTQGSFLLLAVVAFAFKVFSF